MKELPSHWLRLKRAITPAEQSVRLQQRVPAFGEHRPASISIIPLPSQRREVERQPRHIAFELALRALPLDMMVVLLCVGIPAVCQPAESFRRTPGLDSASLRGRVEPAGAEAAAALPGRFRWE
jgi:hypothetical protein